jgi:hypothetical protein
MAFSLFVGTMHAKKKKERTVIRYLRMDLKENFTKDNF